MRGSAWAFDRAAATYRRARPEYPPGVVEHVAAELGLHLASVLVEVGAGTGKFTGALVAGGLRPVALEPLEGMAAELRRTLPEVATAASVAERLPLRDASADGLVAAASFHWFDQDRAAAEFRRVLRPAGGLALLWQARAEAAWPWDRIGPILDRHRGAHPSTSRIVAGVSDLPGFEPLRRASFPHVETRPPAEVVDRVLSVSFIAALPDDARAGVAAEVAAVVDGADEVPLGYDVVVFTTRRS